MRVPRAGWLGQGHRRCPPPPPGRPSPPPLPQLRRSSTLSRRERGAPGGAAGRRAGRRAGTALCPGAEVSREHSERRGEVLDSQGKLLKVESQKHTQIKRKRKKKVTDERRSPEAAGKLQVHSDGLKMPAELGALQNKIRGGGGSLPSQYRWIERGGLKSQLRSSGFQTSS